MPRLATLRDLGASKVGGFLPWNEARIITHGFIAGGYKNSSPWKNVNLTQHSTDTSSNLGDLMSDSGAYLDGGNSDNYFYVFAIGGMGSSSTTWSMNMSTQASRGASTSSWNMTVARDDLGTMVDWQHRSGGGKIYCVGGGNTATDRFTMASETMSTASLPPNTGSSGNVTATFEGEFRGYCNVSSTTLYMNWANETYSSWATTGSPDGWGKGVGSFKTKAYLKDGSFGNGTMRRYDDTSGSSIATFGVQEAAEENLQQGANKGYCLGHYNGSQNNNTYKFNYNSDSSTNLGSTAEPKGQAGMSSAAPASAFSINNSTYGTTAPAF